MPQGSIRGPDLFNILINDMDRMAEGIPSTFAGDTKLGRVADMPQSPAAIRRDPHRLEKWAGRIFIKFSKEKCKILHLQKNRLRASWKAALQRKGP
ncbi:hypothetical protein HGM15179_006419 [Zosterops borbonicus]|uniref:Reverse transcriptase n=1 Tax=Zosterops borbonicus TaxID=364589 RepID=A0A8K1GNM5_9PASS|nr:hypothetical protein HGM15179_006419 [Zosterops borbonicus]